MDSPSCPHCRRPLQPFTLPDNTGWQTDFFFACFNDDCSYYEQGWDWMREHYNHKMSYRYAVNPKTGAPFPLPVWSALATREMIVDHSEGDDE